MRGVEIFDVECRKIDEIEMDIGECQIILRLHNRNRQVSANAAQNPQPPQHKTRNHHPTLLRVFTRSLRQQRKHNNHNGTQQPLALQEFWGRLIHVGKIVDTKKEEKTETSLSILSFQNKQKVKVSSTDLNPQDRSFQVL